MVIFDNPNTVDSDFTIALSATVAERGLSGVKLHDILNTPFRPRVEMQDKWASARYHPLPAGIHEFPAAQLGPCLKSIFPSKYAGETAVLGIRP